MTWPLETMSAQEVADKVVHHLLTQKARSRNDEGSCAYRGKNNLMCAAGCLIPDDKYVFDMEETPWNVLVSRGKVPPTHLALIRDFQIVHDDNRPAEWEPKLKTLLAEHGLAFNFQTQEQSQ